MKYILDRLIKKRLFGQNKLKMLLGLKSFLKSWIVQINICINGIQMVKSTSAIMLWTDIFKKAEETTKLYYTILVIQESNNLILILKLKLMWQSLHQC